MLGNLGFFTFSSPSFSVLMLFCVREKKKVDDGSMQQDGTTQGEHRGGAKMVANRAPSVAPCSVLSWCQDGGGKPSEHLNLGEEVDPDPLGLQVAGLFDPHAKVLHVRQDDVLHRSAGITRSANIRCIYTIYIQNNIQPTKVERWRRMNNGSDHATSYVVVPSSTLAVHTIWAATAKAIWR